MPADVARFSLHGITERSPAAERALPAPVGPAAVADAAGASAGRNGSSRSPSCPWLTTVPRNTPPTGHPDRPARMAARQEAARIRRRTVAATGRPWPRSRRPWPG